MTTKVPENLKYSEEHEWILLEGEIVTCGITDFAQSSLGDIVFIELPEVGITVDQGVACGVVESIKSVSDLCAPVSGEIVEINQDLEDEPGQCNADPYGTWLYKIKISSPEEYNNLLTADQYNNFCQKNN